jgi:HD-like signal output (HDOD) protein
MKKILFVDDDPSILQGLQRMLRKHGREWHMEFAGGGDEAKQRLTREPFDVIVTDMRMPGVDGAALLAHVHNLYPQTVRIVLTGHAETEAAMRAVSVAHQFLCKPCDPDVLKGVVNRACGLHSLLAGTSLTETIGTIDSLPVLPTVYRDLLAALADPEVELEDVADVVARDPGISAKILQLVNSSFFGLARAVTDMRQATSCLGLNTIRNLTLSVEVFRSFEGHDPGIIKLEREQRHALLAARIAKQLLPNRIQSENAFLAAMLHDVGKLIMAFKMPEAFAAAERDRQPDEPGYAAEERLHGVSHAEIGAYLLGLWGLPYPIVEAVANHHHPGRVPHTSFDILGAVHVAEYLAFEQEGDGSSGEGVIDETYLADLGVLPELPRWRALAAEQAV